LFQRGGIAIATKPFANFLGAGIEVAEWRICIMVEDKLVAQMLKVG